jgi:hypothetical protein
MSSAEAIISESSIFGGSPIDFSIIEPNCVAPIA